MNKKQKEMKTKEMEVKKIADSLLTARTELSNFDYYENDFLIEVVKILMKGYDYSLEDFVSEFIGDIEDDLQRIKDDLEEAVDLMLKEAQSK